MFLFAGCNQKVVVDIVRSEVSTSFVDVYTIKYSDGTTSSFSVEKGQDGEDLKIEDIYNKALSAGYTGSFLEFVEEYLEISYTNENESITTALRSSVSITSEFRVEGGHFLNKYNDIAIGSGSGVIYKLDKANGDAYIITNYHVVYNASSLDQNHISSKIKCYLYGADMSRGVKTSGDEYVLDSDGFPIVEYLGDAIDCTYVGGSMTNDIAVLKVTNSTILKNSSAISATVFNSDDVAVGDTAIAIGNPEGEGISVTRGIVSVDSEHLQLVAADETTNVTFRVMRIDTPVNSGNSGGGLYRADGTLMGIVNAKNVEDGIENIGYAIPSTVATRVADNIINNAGDGKAKKATLGITIESKNCHSEYNQQYGVLKIVEDVYVYKVESGSLAETYGLRAGDHIVSVSINGTKYPITRSYQIVDLCWLMEVGDVVKFEISGKSTPISLIISSTSVSVVE